MLRILCYGDSNTWGTDPITHLRYNEKTRFTKLLQNLLGGNSEVIEEGLPARTLITDDIKYPKGNRNGSLFVGQCLISHDPLDFVIIMLGTNDIKDKFNVSLDDIVKGLNEKYINFIKKDLAPFLTKIPQIILIAPSEIKGCLFENFDKASEQKSKMFNKIYKKAAIENNCLFISNKKLFVGNDGVHLTQQSHEKLAKKKKKKIKKYLIN